MIRRLFGFLMFSKETKNKKILGRNSHLSADLFIFQEILKEKIRLLCRDNICRPDLHVKGKVLVSKMILKM